MNKGTGYNEDIVWDFEDLEGLTVTCSLNVVYRYAPGKYSGPPEDCYPDECEGEITLLGVMRVCTAYGYVEPESATRNQLREAVNSRLDSTPLDSCGSEQEAIFQYAEELSNERY